MEPVRECQRSKYFYQDGSKQWHPCTEHDEGAVKKTIFEIEGDSLAVPPVKRYHFNNALSRTHTSVGADELEHYISWTKEFGEEGS